MLFRKFFYFIIPLWLICGSLFGESDGGIDFDLTDPLFVSLGSFCGPASTLKTCGHRKAAFPFDWYLSVDGQKLIQILEENFLHFFDLNYLKASPAGNLLNTYYHLEFPHEGNWKGQNFNKNFTEFVAKYDRRIQRFRKLNSYQGPVFFIRQAWQLSDHPNYAFRDSGNIRISPEYANHLYEALKKFFPSLNVHLIILNEPEVGTPDITMSGNIIFINTHIYDLNEMAKFYAECSQ